MSGIAGLLRISDSTRKLVSIGEQVIFDAANEYFAAHNADLQAAIRVFVEGTTEGFKSVYRLPGGGRLQRRGGQAPSGAVKTGGSWDVSFPLEDFGTQYAWSDIAMAYMTVADLQLQIDTTRAQDMGTVRYEMLKALLNNTARSFSDPLHGTLTIQPLANGDAVVYPPVIGSETETTDNHYRVSGYAASAISDTNNPYETLRDELEEHSGTPSGYGNIAVFINPAQKAKTELLTDYDQVSDVNIRSGQDANIPINLPNVPGRILGRTNGVWVVEWRWTPSSYAMAVDLDSPGPLMKRRDPVDTGLGEGLQLVATNSEHPITSSHYRHRFGFGVGNRLGAAVMFLDAGGSYTIPAIYA